VGSMTRAAGGCSAGGLLISGALAIRSSLVDHCDVSTARPLSFLRGGLGSGNPSVRVGRGGWSTLLGPEETGTRLFLSGAGCLQVALDRACLVGGLGWAYGPVLPPYHACFPLFLGCGWFGGGVGWCPFVF
jgi:hypothetical protein